MDKDEFNGKLDYLDALVTYSEDDRRIAAAAVELAAEQVTRAEMDLAEAVTAARDVAVAWSTIGRLTEMSKQGAQQKWGA